MSFATDFYPLTPLSVSDVTSILRLISAGISMIYLLNSAHLASFWCWIWLTYIDIRKPLLEPKGWWIELNIWKIEKLLFLSVMIISIILFLLSYFCGFYMPIMTKLSDRRVEKQLQCKMQWFAYLWIPVVTSRVLIATTIHSYDQNSPSS